MTNGVYFVTNKVYFVTNKVCFVTNKVCFVRNKVYFVTNKVCFVRNKVYFVTNRVYFVTNGVYFVTNKVCFVTNKHCFAAKATFLSYEEALLHRRNTYKHQPVNKKRAQHGHKTHPRSCILHAPKRLRDRGNRRRRHHGPDRQQKPVAESCVVIGGPSAGSFEAASPRLRVFRNSHPYVHVNDGGGLRMGKTGWNPIRVIRVIRG